MYDEIYYAEEQMLINPMFFKVAGIIFLIVIGVFLSEYSKGQKFNKKRKQEFYNNTKVFVARFSRRNDILASVYTLIAGISWLVAYNANIGSAMIDINVTSDDVLFSFLIRVLGGAAVFVYSGIAMCIHVRRETIMKYRTLFITDDTIYLSVCKENGNPIIIKKELTGIKDAVALKNRTGFELFPLESLQIRTESAVYEVEGIVDAPQIQYLIEKRRDEVAKMS